MEPLTKLLNVPTENILMFPGSDVALDALVRTFVMPGDEAIL
ncbi:MAG: histidinol-phosphate aminotransferase, partial [Chloroflexi bacterium]|nr:histidinol-phosphate aminotransferase [Chloroflexota bacterium]